MYAVLGATGNTGSVVARELLARGAQVRVIVRDADKVRTLADRGAEVAVARIEDTGALAKALRGVQGAYVMTPPLLDPNDIAGALRTLTESLARAIAEAGVPHVVLLSSVGAHLPSGTGPIVNNRHTEIALRAVTPALSAVRAPYFMDNWIESFAALDDGKLLTMWAPERPIDQISSEDIGRLAAGLVLEGSHGHEVVELSGPTDYSPIDAARALSKLLGRTIEPLHVPNEAIVPALIGAGLPRNAAESYREMYEAIDRGLVHEGKGARALRGSVTLEQALSGLLARAGIARG